MDYIISELIRSLVSRYSSSSTSEHLQNEITAYLSKLYSKLKTTKNIIYKNEPVDFNRIYVPLTLTNDSYNIRLIESRNIFEDFDKVVVIGDAGSGKSTLMQFVTLQCIDYKYAIPVFIELRNYNSKKQKFARYVAMQVSESHFNSMPDLFEQGGFAFVLDGYDEINYVGGGELIEQVQSFIFDYPNNKFLISSRPGTNIESLNPFYVFRISPLDENDVALFIDKFNYPSVYKRKISNYLLKEKEFGDILKNPLFLSLYILSFDVNSEKLNNKKSVFLRNIVDALFASHDSVSKLGYVRDRITNLNKDQLERVASILAFRSLLSSKMQFTKDELYREFDLIRISSKFEFENKKLLYDLTITTNILFDGYNYFEFPHILILEYLASTFISKLDEDQKSFVYNGMIKKADLRISSTFLEFLFELDMRQLIKLYLLPYLEIIDNENFHYQYQIREYVYTNFNIYSILEFLSSIVTPNTSIGDIESNDIHKMISYLKKNVDINETDQINPLFDMF